MVVNIVMDFSLKETPIKHILVYGWMILLVEDGNAISLNVHVFIGEDTIVDSERMLELCVIVSISCIRLSSTFFGILFFFFCSADQKNFGKGKGKV